MGDASKKNQLINLLKGLDLLDNTHIWNLSLVKSNSVLANMGIVHNYFA